MRHARIIVPGLAYHLILRGNNRRRLFSYRWEYREFLSLMADALRGTDVAIHALALMANHVHIAATPASRDGASRFVRSFAQRYAQRRNRRRASSGKLFEQRFKSFPLVDAWRLADATAYIELNPVRAGVCDAPGDYPWSTYGLHAGTSGGHVPAELWTPSPWYLSLGDSSEIRRARYAAWVEQCRTGKLVPEFVFKQPGEPRIRRPDGSRAT
jgi:putative transposase